MFTTVNRDNQKALIVKKLVEKHKVTPAYVYLVIDGKRNNEAIFSEYIDLHQALEMLWSNTLAPCIAPQFISYNNQKSASI
jgi:hypothetical protein